MKHLSLNRRHFLRAAGVTLALPLLDVFASRAAGGDGSQPIRRMLCMSTSLGIYGGHLFPKRAGRDFESTPYLEIVKDFREQMTIFSGVSHPDIDAGQASEASFLTSAPHPGSSSFRNSISLDQYVIEKQGSTTRFGSLILTTGNGHSLSFNRSGVMIPSDNRPSALFKKLFVNGSSSDVRQQIERLNEGRSVLDLVLGQSNDLQKRVGSEDRRRLDQYFTSVREVEDRMLKTKQWADRPKPKVNARPPTDIMNNADVIGRTRLLFDLIHLAIQTDSTRLATVALTGLNVVPVIQGVTQDWHNLSHHGKDPAKIAELKVIESAQLECLRDFLAKLKATPDQGATLLDHTMVLYGSNLGNAASHDTKNLPIMLFGGGFRHGQHLAFDERNNQPLCQVFVSMIQRMGIESEQFGSGKGRLGGLDMT